MKVRFIEPPPAQRVGGLDAAIRALESALIAQGVELLRGTDTDVERGEVVHFHGLWQPSHALLSRSLSRRGIQIVISPHGMLEPWAWRHKWWKKWPYFLLAERAHLRRANCLLATAPMEEARIAKLVTARRTITLPLGFTGEARPDYDAARAKLGWEKDETVLLFLSRLHEKKGLDLLLRAMGTVKPSVPCRLVIVGGGESGYVAKLKELASRLSISRIDWVGEIWGEDRWKYFQGADLFCLPSHSENFGLAVLEALQVGTPVLTTTTTPWGEWLQPDRGIIVEPTLAGAVEGLRRFFSLSRSDSAARDALADWSRAKFSWDTLGEKYVDLYSALLAEARSVRRSSGVAGSGTRR